MAKQSNPVETIAEEIATAADSDVLLYVGEINISSARKLVDLVNKREGRRRHVLFILGTNGGDANAAYKIARCLQHAYEKGDFTIAVYGDCKSAGTLVAIAAKSIVMCQHGELGPLDVQLQKEDQLFSMSSGLTPKQALESLKSESLSQFEHFMLTIHARSGFQISTKLAASIAIRMVTGLLGPVYEQIDPLRVGETQRAMDVAQNYGRRLDKSSNLKPGALQRLVEGYPSHDFAIDFDEADELFNRCRRTTDRERLLGEALAHHLLSFRRISDSDAMFLFLNEENQTEGVEDADEKGEERATDSHKHLGSGEGGPLPEENFGGAEAAADGDGKEGSRARGGFSRKREEPIALG